MVRAPSSPPCAGWHVGRVLRSGPPTSVALSLYLNPCPYRSREAALLTRSTTTSAMWMSLWCTPSARCGVILAKLRNSARTRLVVFGRAKILKTPGHVLWPKRRWWSRGTSHNLRACTPERHSAQRLWTASKRRQGQSCCGATWTLAVGGTARKWEGAGTRQALAVAGDLRPWHRASFAHQWVRRRWP